MDMPSIYLYNYNPPIWILPAYPSVYNTLNFVKL